MHVDCRIATFQFPFIIYKSLRLQGSLFYIQKWLKKWKIRVNGARFVQVTFTTRKETCYQFEKPSS